MTPKTPPDLKPFTPCSPHCPSVTGKPYGTVTYCPKAENERHKHFMAEHKGHRDHSRDSDGNWTQLEWRTGERVVVTFDDGGGCTPSIPQHPDDTDCCLDFGCCPDAFAGEFGATFAALAGTRESGAEVVHVKAPESRGNA